MTSFEITTAKDFLAKLKEEQNDFATSHLLSSRHALNAILTAYHLQEWVWGQCHKSRPDLVVKWKDISAFRAFVLAQCPALDDASKIANGTKHFQHKIRTGKHSGAFQAGVFQADVFDVSYLWIDRGGTQQRADEFIQELINFWDGFFSSHNL